MLNLKCYELKVNIITLKYVKMHVHGNLDFYNIRFNRN